jgi:lipoprotein-anchoring transpeptidase ErfK/SrfK
MSRTLLIRIGAVVLVSIAGLMAVSIARRAGTQRAGAASAQAADARTVAAHRLQTLGAIERAAAPPKPAVTPAPSPQPSFGVARVKPGRTVVLRSRPGGRVLANVGSTTQFGSPTTLAVAARRGGWIGVTSTDLPNGTLGWVKTGTGSLQTYATRISLRIDLSSRSLELLDGRRVLRRARVGIGRPGSPTPTGRFSITDKIAGGTYGAYYGCCVLALSGHQVNPPPGWQGGNRLAIHGTNDPTSIGVPSSAGCLHAEAADLEVLMRRVPLGTPVLIRA